MRFGFGHALLLAAGVLSASLATATIANGIGFGRDALRSVVAACAVSKAALGLSFPCTDVKPDAPGADGYAIIRSPGYNTEFLLAPLGSIDGIESPELAKDSATGFWQAAWATGRDVSAALGRPIPRTELGLAVNASGTRTQDHFHIHVDCLRQSVGQALASQSIPVGQQWTKLPPMRGQTYWVRAIAGSDLGGVNIPRLLADAPPARNAPLDHATLAVTGARLADGTDGFYLLANWSNVSAERLLDHLCRGV